MTSLLKIKNYLSALKKLAVDYASTVYIAKNKTADGVDGRVICYADKDSYIAEQYKTMRTNLYSLASDRPLKTIVITSAHAEEGKTLTSCNLAMAISLDMKKKVVLVDADLRTPEVHKIYSLPKSPGFTDVYNGGVKLGDLLKKPAVGNLYIITAGTYLAGPSEIWLSPKIKNIIEELKSRFDYVIFDSTPMLHVIEAGILGELCDGVFQVVKAGVTPKGAIEETFNLLRDAKCKPIATILVNCDNPFDYFSRYKYYRYPYDKAKT